MGLMTFVEKLRMFSKLTDIVVEENPFLLPDRLPRYNPGGGKKNPKTEISSQLQVETIDGMKLADY